MFDPRVKSHVYAAIHPTNSLNSLGFMVDDDTQRKPVRHSQAVTGFEHFDRLLRSTKTLRRPVLLKTIRCFILANFETITFFGSKFDQSAFLLTHFANL